ncbi:MAG: NTP transferase domain-containing protein [Anaerolineae bacterium]|nr:NTP transferase domain-containing protein [Anaerolineae bacterium]
MKLVIFAGGSGRRLWPISRQASPKQFEPIIGDRSTLQLAVGRVEASYGLENIFISTNERYVDIIARQLPGMPAANLIGEPTRRDLAAAVGLAMMHLSHAAAPNEPVAILWGDNYMNEVPTFVRLLAAAEQLIEQGQGKIIFMGETPRFANENLGWLGLGGRVGEINGTPYYQFGSLTYRPQLEQCQQMFAQKSHVWNTGYFITTCDYVLAAYQKHQPEMWDGLAKIQAAIGLPHYQETLHRVYPHLPVASFDDAILTHLDPADALVLHDHLGWSDPGSLYALKEAINPNAAANVTQGLVQLENSQDCLVYNYEPHKLLAAVGLEGMIVINTPDAILVVPKDQIPLVKKMVDGLVGTALEKYS